MFFILYLILSTFSEWDISAKNNLLKKHPLTDTFGARGYFFQHLFFSVWFNNK